MADEILKSENTNSGQAVSDNAEISCQDKDLPSSQQTLPGQDADAEGGVAKKEDAKKPKKTLRIKPVSLSSKAESMTSHEPVHGDAYLELKRVGKEYVSDAGGFWALKEVSFTLKNGEFVVILGPSGAGKTTLLNLLGGMDSVTTGEISLNGLIVSNLNKKQLTQYRRTEIGFVFQFYNLMPNLTALENIELATEICRDALPPAEILKSVGLEDKAKNFPAQLSGGEQQRVSIARAIAKNPKLLLCDEPTGALDYKTGKSILELLHSVSKEHNKLVIIVTHNSALKDMADKVIYIKNGEIGDIVENKNPKPISEIEW